MCATLAKQEATTWQTGRFHNTESPGKPRKKSGGCASSITHLGAYVIGNVIIGLWNAGTYYLRDNDNLWFWLPLLFWGLGVIVHYLQSVALFDNWWDRDERLIEERLKRTDG